MTPRMLISLNIALNELARVTLPYKAARRVAGLIRRVKEEVALIADMERQIVEAHGGEVTSAGDFRFGEGARTDEFLTAYNAFLDEEDDGIRLTPVDLSKYTEALRLTPGAVEALDGIIIFGGEDDGG